MSDTINDPLESGAHEESLEDKNQDDHHDTQEQIHKTKINRDALYSPEGLLRFKFLLNPIRLLILNILNENSCHSTSDLRKLMDIPWGTFTDHTKALEKKNYVEIKQEFVDDSPTKTICITRSGRYQYNTLLHSLVKTLNL